MKISTDLKNLIQLAFANLIVITVTIFAAAAAVVAIYRGLTYGIVSLLPKLFTLVLPTVTLLLGIRVICLRHPVHALLCLIAIFFNTVLVYLSAEAEFLALVFLIVYVGAIAILFLFVIRLLNVKELTAAPRRGFNFQDRRFGFILAPLAGCFRIFTPALLGKVITDANLVLATTESSALAALEYYVSWRFQDIRRFSQLLYSYYGYLFMLIALLLLTARLGAIILATSSSAELKISKK